ncbi:MAG: glycerophosphodiester phosphodiesterase [Gammaproteobacteria bacterium]|nr:MAG: glycerophosphodiester phosphodiesterase [Gammaproteobacteria bacterium]
MTASIFRPQQLIAHRGQSATYPENTIIALEAAVAAGARAIEVDVQCLADDTPILFHDINFKRVCADNRKLFSIDKSQLGELSAYEPSRFGDEFKGTPIATLEELVSFLEQHPDIHCFVEIKKQSIRKMGKLNCLKMLDQVLAPVHTQCTLLSYHRGFVETALKQNHFPIGLIIRFRWQLRRLNPALAVCFCDVKRMRKKDNLHELPVRIAVYEVSEKALVSQWLDRGARWIETNDIEKLLNETPEPTWHSA